MNTPTTATKAEVDELLANRVRGMGTVALAPGLTISADRLTLRIEGTAQIVLRHVNARQLAEYIGTWLRYRAEHDAAVERIMSERS